MSEHILSPRANYLVFAGLIVLTFLTVGLSFVELGEWHTVIGLIIASAKTLLVVLFFMHVWYSTRLTWVVVLSGLFFLAIMLGLTLTDYMSRKWLWF